MMREILLNNGWTFTEKSSCITCGPLKERWSKNGIVVTIIPGRKIFNAKKQGRFIATGTAEQLEAYVKTII